MYLPKHFSQEQEPAVHQLIQENGFATILSFPENEIPFVNHLPLTFSSQANEENVLIGHMAKRNPQWQHFLKNPKCMVIIHGPHTYITPSWYRSGRDVPTWNYAIAHLHGRIELIEKFEGQIDVLKQLTDFYEKPNAKPWEFELPDDLLDPSALTSAIISFKFHIEKTEAKFKLSQNRSKEDQAGVLEGLEGRKDGNSLAIRKLMLQNSKKQETKS